MQTAEQKILTIKEKAEQLQKGDINMTVMRQFHKDILDIVQSSSSKGNQQQQQLEEPHLAKRPRVDTIAVQDKQALATGATFGCGSDKDRKLGVDGKYQKKPVKSDFGDVQFINANYATSFIDASGKLFVNGTEETRVNGPLKYATKGDNYSRFAIDANDRLFTWGGSKRGQLGHGNENGQATPKLVDALKGHKIRQISVHENRVACTTEADEVFVWGCDCTTFGLGYCVTTPTKLDQRASHVEVGSWHAMVIYNGEVFSIGENNKGQLGLGDNNDRIQWNRVKLASGEKVRQIQCGFCCSAILTDRALYVTGQYLIGGKNDKVNKPTRVQLDNISVISLNYWHILALNQNGEVYSWGRNCDGRCGVDSDADHIEKPTRVAIPKQYVVTQISAGLYHSMFKCETKTVKK